ncbi:hypothetical protein CR513_03685, partial [Mucuna pruriens]
MVWTLPLSEQIHNDPIPSQFRELMIDPFDGSQDPRAHLQAFQTHTYISEANDHLSCKLFLSTLRGVAMRWFSGLPPCSITSFVGLVATFESQFAANKMKSLEVVDLFDIKQSRTETLKQYLAHFKAAMVQVDYPDQKFFIKAFQKGLQAGPFSDSLALSLPASMIDIRARVEKHVEAEEDKEDQLQVERAVLAFGKKNTHNF